MSRLPSFVDCKSIEWPFDIITRRDIAERGKHLKSIMKDNTWWGVYQYAKNDNNWDIHFDAKIRKDIIMVYCNLHNAAMITNRFMMRKRINHVYME